VRQIAHKNELEERTKKRNKPHAEPDTRAIVSAHGCKRDARTVGPDGCRFTGAGAGGMLPKGNATLLERHAQKHEGTRKGSPRAVALLELNKKGVEVFSLSAGSDS
jgi:hypothetical protein